MGEHHARIYRLVTTEKLDLPPHSAAVHGTAFSPDGKFLASVGNNRQVRVCDAMTGMVVWQTQELHGLTQCVAYTADGKWLGTGDFDSDAAWICDAHTGKRLLKIGNAGKRPTMSVQFSPDGRHVATCGDETQIWEIEQGQPGDRAVALKAKLLKSQRGGFSLVFSPDNRHVAFYNDGLYLWDLDKSAGSSCGNRHCFKRTVCILYTGWSQVVDDEPQPRGRDPGCGDWKQSFFLPNQ